MSIFRDVLSNNTHFKDLHLYNLVRRFTSHIVNQAPNLAVLCTCYEVILLRELFGQAIVK
jgi:hypothetical protein